MEKLEKGALPSRNEIPEEYKWDLTKMFASNEDWQREFKAIEDLLSKVSSFKGKLNQSGKTLLEGLTHRDEITRRGSHLFTYARMKRDEDNGASTYQGMADNAQNLMTRVQSATAFFEPEILTIPEATINQFLSLEEGLKLYRHHLEDIIRGKAHTLTDIEEEILANTGEMAQAPYNVFSMLNNADIKFPYIKDENNEEIEITHGRYSKILESRDRRVREDGFKGLLGTYEKYKNTYSAMVSANVKNQIFYAKMRKFPSAMEASLFEDNIPVEVYNTLIDVTHSRLDLLHRYLEIRKKLLKIPDLHLYDLYTPMITDFDIKVSYEEAKEIILEGLKPLGSEYISLIEEGFNNRWIDVCENRGKTSGAYSWGSYDSPPYILMNYQDNLNNLFTLAHELGHSIHSYYTHRNQPPVYGEYTIFLAEIASTLNEGLLMDYMLENTDDPKKKLYILNYYLEQFRTTFYRQTMFAEYERNIHGMVEGGDALTADILSETYYELNKKYFGSNITVDKEIEMEWARIPHFYYNFYVYKYATGFASALAILKGIKDNPKENVPKYLEMLKSGSSDYSLNILKKAGVDMTSSKPIEDCLVIFSSILDKMEELI